MEHMNPNNVKYNEAAVKEVIDILKDMPEERQAYLNGYAAGMNAERRLSESDQRTA